MKHNEKTTDLVSINSILGRENMLTAWRKVKSNRGSAGVDGMDIEQSEKHIRKHWETIKSKLLAGKYTPAAVRAVEIPKADGGVRRLGIPNVIDRLIMQAISQQLNPIWEEKFSEHSYGYRATKSAHDAVKAGQEFVKKGKVWVVDIDLKNFFDEINHDRLMSLVGREVRDKPTLRLLGRFLRAPMRQPDGSQRKRYKGTPQGSPLSPLLANIYLNELDWELEKRGLSFVRYADDIAIFVSSERAAARVLESVTKWIEKNLKVPVNTDKSGTNHTDEGALLGFRIHSDGEIGISPKAINKLKENVRRLWNARQPLTSVQLRTNWRAFITGWWNYFSIASRLWEVSDLNGWIRRRIRRCFWKRWKTPAGRKNALKRLGVNHRAIGIAYTGLGAWRVARTRPMHQALSNKVLRKHGFIIPWEFAK
jgi:group II intron reverse transcriptase/maturase